MIRRIADFAALIISRIVRQVKAICEFFHKLAGVASVNIRITSVHFV
jgi:hypothetical protein